MTLVAPERLADLWEASVRATHAFLEPRDIPFYRAAVLELLPCLDVRCLQDGHLVLCGFVALSPPGPRRSIEMLFVSPDRLGRGWGSLLLRLAVSRHGARRVAVNEENLPALRFYRKHGFRVMGRDPRDPFDRPYPVLHLGL